MSYGATHLRRTTCGLARKATCDPHLIRAENGSQNMPKSLIEHLSQTLSDETQSLRRPAVALQRDGWLCQLSLVDALRNGGSSNDATDAALAKKVADLEFLLGMG